MSRVVNRSDGRSMRLPSRILNLKSHRDGYVYTTLSRDGQASSFLVHRLVAAAFMECPTGRIRHVSGDRSDNRLVNLLDADTISPVERLWERTTVDESTGCWVFAGALNRGYGMISVDGVAKLAHRVAYRELIDQDLSDDLTIDHVTARGCRSKACWNPEHLEAVTTQENTRRRDSNLARAIRGPRPRETHCLRGHERTAANVEKSGNCRECANERRRERRRRAKRVYPSEELGL